MVAERRRVVGSGWALLPEQPLAAVSDGVALALALVAGLIAQLVGVLAPLVALVAVLAADVASVVVPVSGEDPSVGMGDLGGAAALGLLDEV